MSELRTDFKDEILQEGETHRVYNIKRKGTDEIVESEVYLEKAYEALQEGDEFGARDVNEIHGRLNGLGSMNLLINGDFRNPINQRGQTSYSNINNYTVDRWMLKNTGTVVVNNGLITLDNTSGTSSMVFAQFIEKSNIDSNQKHTFSIKADNEILTTTFIQVTTDYQVVSFSKFDVVFYYSTDRDAYTLYLDIKSGNSINIKWIKLEQGLIATPFVPRLCGEELALCQRYYQTIDRLFLYPESYSNSKTYFNGCFLPMPMRTIPTKIMEQGSAVFYNEKTISYFSIDGQVNDGMYFNGTLDAEIY